MLYRLVNEKKQRKCNYSSCQCAIYIQPVECALWEIRLRELIKDISTRGNCYDTKALFKRGIDDGQSEKYLHHNTSPVSD